MPVKRLKKDFAWLDRLCENKLFFTSAIFDLLGTVSLAFSINVLPSTQLYGVHQEMGGNDVNYPVMMPRRFWMGLLFLGIGTCLNAVDRWQSSEEKVH